jgi:hypothetical protein
VKYGEMDFIAAELILCSVLFMFDVQVKLLEACVLMVACEGKETTSCDLFVVLKKWREREERMGGASFRFF